MRGKKESGPGSTRRSFYSHVGVKEGEEEGDDRGDASQLALFSLVSSKKSGEKKRGQSPPFTQL